jgi:hypothetical protein
MYLKTDKITMSIDGVTIYSHDSIPAPKFLFDPTALIGWLDGADIKRSTQTRPVSDGDFAEEMNFSSRVIIASGSAVANTVPQIHKMRDDFIKILSDKSYKTLTVTDSAGISRYATVSLANKTSWIQETDTTAVWKLELYAPDPYIYGVENNRTVGANIVVGGLDFTSGLGFPLDYNISGQDTTQIITNNGNAKMWPIFKITGDYVSGFTITNNMSQKVTYNGLVTYQAPVFIDMARGTAIQNNSDRSYLITDRDWISVNPGETIRPGFIPIQNGTGWCEILYRDTWI